MKIAILGAGAMGCFTAAHLCGKNQVTLIDSYLPQVEAVREHGVTVTHLDGSETVCRIPICESGKCTEVPDLLIVFVKATATDAALAANASVIGKDTLVLSLQNGLGNDAVLEKYVPRERILLGTTLINCVTAAPGKTLHTAEGLTNLGALAGDGAKAAAIADLFSESGIETVVCEDIRHLLWKKLFVNMTVNALTAILDCKIGFLAETAHAAPLIDSLLTEAVAVAAADGVPFDKEEVKAQLYASIERLKAGRASMCQDMEKHRRTEIDFINGAVVRLGKQYGIPTPTHNAAVALIHALEDKFDA